MQDTRQLVSGLILALASLVFVIGGATLALAESGFRLASPANPTQVLPTFTPSLAITPTIHAAFTATGTNNIPTTTPTEIITIAPPSTCSPPAGWMPILVLPNDTLPELASIYNTSTNALRQANCLTSDTLIINTYLYVPVSSAPTNVTCGIPAGWIQHVVQPGENLFRIGINYGGTSAARLQQANCMGSSTKIYVGQRIWVPNVPTITPTASYLPPPTLTPTDTPPIPASTNTATEIPSAIPTLTPIPPTPTGSQAPIPTNTP
ncbi:MAG: LysM peptidoglycan-binding domain-containing protein [Anaerolineales bacterium]|nr:LysM peptidoglycan-binding domain-containing protein [Anaerolineales bacterium]